MDDTLTMSSTDPLSPVEEGRAVTWKPSSVLDVSVRGKGNKDKAGWGALPPAILHRILHHSIDDIELDGAQPRLVPHPGRSRTILRAALGKIWLCRLRLVSSPWRDAVDSSSFWDECTHQLSPQFNPQLYPDSPRLTSSTKSPSAFSRARAAITPVCLVCRVNRPMFRPSASDKRYLTPTPKYGLLSSCLGHFDRFCFGCLTAAPDNQTADDTFPASASDLEDEGHFLALAKSTSGDVDENGHERYRPIRQCADCRKVIIDRQIEQLLVQCSRGGPVRGGLARSLTQTAFYTDYVMWSKQTAYHAAQMAVEECWLSAQTRWDELMHPALDLQNHCLALKMQYKVQGLFETPEQKRKRHAILHELWGGAKGHDYRVDEANLGTRYKAWNSEVLHNLFEEELEPCDRLPLDGRAQLKFASIEDWITTRISYGLWVAPSEEVRLLLADPIGHFKHFRRVALSAVHPAHTDSDDNPSFAVEEFDGLMDLRVKPGAPFLPTPRLLEDLDHDYRESLKATVIDAMEELVDGVLKQCGGDSDAADRICERMGVEEILAALTNKLIWTNKGYTMAVEAMMPTKAPSISAAGSPRIELIHEQVVEPQFLIEVDGEAVSEAPATTEELQTAIITMAQSTTPTERSTKRAEQANEPVHVSPSPKTKRKQPEDSNPEVDERRKRPFPSSSSPEHSGLETDSAQSSDDVWSVPGPITPDDFVPYTSPLNADMGAVSQSTAGKNDASATGESLASDSPLTTSSSLSAVSSPARGSESPPAGSTWDSEPDKDSRSEESKLNPESNPTKLNLQWHTLPEEIPWIPQASPDMLGNVTVQCIMAVWFQARAVLRECRCGICEREKRRGWGALFAH